MLINHKMLINHINHQLADNLPAGTPKRAVQALQRINEVEAKRQQEYIREAQREQKLARDNKPADLTKDQTVRVSTAIRYIRGEKREFTRTVTLAQKPVFFVPPTHIEDSYWHHPVQSIELSAIAA
jgi:hypothetical protein